VAVAGDGGVEQVQTRVWDALRERLR
jgi:hypothetical protein